MTVFVMLMYLSSLLPAALGLAKQCKISQVKVTNVSSTAANINWSIGDCISDVDSYTILVDHAAWLACLDNINDREESGRSTGQVFFTRYALSRLYPYSRYNITIQALDAYKSVMDSYQFELLTQSDVPDTKPSLPDQAGSSVYSQAVRFNWGPPPQTDCRHQNGRQDGYWVELRGLDPWVLDPLILANQSVTGTFFHASDLLPYTSYMLRVFSMNVGGLFNRNVYLELQERTGSMVPAAPVSLTASTVSESAVYLSWKPSYPRTGLIEKYVVREGVVHNNNNHVWSKQISVNTAHHNSCGLQKQRTEGFVCYVINELLPATKYIFQVQTINKGVEAGSPWSRSVVAVTHGSPVPSTISPPVPLPTSPAAPYNQDGAGGGGGSGPNTLMIVLVVVGAVVILGTLSACLIYKLKLDKLKARLEHEHSVSLGRLDSTYGPYSPGSTTTQATNYTVTPNSFIQDRRLPEPPPARPGDHVYSSPYSHEGYLDMSLGRASMKSRNSGPFDGNRLDSGGGGGEDGDERAGGEALDNDTDGYLRPNFSPAAQKTSRVIDCDDARTTVPAASYGVTVATAVGQAPRQPAAGQVGQLGVRPDVLPPPGSCGRGSPSSSHNSSSSNHPLVISKSVDI